MPEDLIICEKCNDYFKEFMEFYRKTRTVNDLFDDLSKRKEIGEEELMYVRRMYLMIDTEIEMTSEIIEDEVTIIETLNEYEHELEYGLNEEEVVTAEEIKVTNNDEEEEETLNPSHYYNFSCHLCEPSVVFPKMHFLSAHSRTVHNTLPQVHCEGCNKTLHTTKAVNHHFELHYRNNFKYECEKCGKIYKTEVNYKNHLKKCIDAGNDRERKFTCDLCNKSFKENRHLVVHMNTHLPDEEKFTNSCSICGKKYSSIFSLRQHVKVVHVNQAKFKCQHCDKSFSRKANLDSHLNVHSMEKRFECSHCGLMLKTKANLRVHQKLHSDDIVVCKFCDKRFKTSNQLINHMVIHSDVKKYECRICENVSYKRSKELKSHMLSVHLNIKKYHCLWCDRAFVNNSNFRKHKLTVHPIEMAEHEKNIKEDEQDEFTEYLIIEEINN